MKFTKLNKSKILEKIKNPKIFWGTILVLFLAVGLFSFSAIAQEKWGDTWVGEKITSVKNLTANLFSSTNEPDQIILGNNVPEELKEVSLIQENLEFKPFEETIITEKVTTQTPSQLSPSTLMTLAEMSESLEKAEQLAKQIQSALSQLEAKGYGQTDINDLPQDTSIAEIPVNPSYTPNIPVGLIQPQIN